MNVKRCELVSVFVGMDIECELMIPTLSRNDRTSAVQ